MVSLSLTMFVIVLVMLCSRISTANQQDSDMILLGGAETQSHVFAGEKQNPLSSEKGINDGVPKPSEMGLGIKGGRKMLASDSVGLSMTNRRNSNAEAGEFVAFNADYHVPRPHPPKNN